MHCPWEFGCDSLLITSHSSIYDVNVLWPSPEVARERTHLIYQQEFPIKILNYASVQESKQWKIDIEVR